MPEGSTIFNPWLRIARDGRIIVIVGRSEMGQGVATSLSMLVAEELEAPLERIVTQFAPADSVYDNPVIGMQITVGSLSTQTGWLPLRRAGAEVRERLIAAAAKLWGVKPQECRAENAEVIHRQSGRRLAYGALAEKAAALPPPANPRLKDPGEFRLLGKSTPRLDLPGHIAGRTVFGTDVVVPNMLRATVLLPPVFGARPGRIDASEAKTVAGLREILKIADGIAVVADDNWSAMQARDRLKVAWEGGKKTLASPAILRRFRKAAEREGVGLRDDGQVDQALGASARVIEAEYETPYLAHAPIEPMNCTAIVTEGRCEIWVPTQGQTRAQEAAARAAGVPVDRVEVHTTFLGGGFGRRAVPDVVSQAVEIAKAVGKPIQLLWTREEDIRHDRFRPASLVRLKGGLDGRGRPTAWFQRIVGPELAHEGVTIPYAIPNLRVESVKDDPGVPTGYWRSVGSSQNAFAIEGFVDELAHAAGADPVEFRLSLLGKSPRHRRVLEVAAEESKWGGPIPEGRTRGVAVYYAHGGWAAQVAELSMSDAGAVKVHRVVCAVDCGFVVNPDNVAAQIEGAVAFGLTAALKAAITIEGGHAVESSFRDYPLLTIAEMPAVEVHIVPSREDPSGAGECGVPPIAPAVANALFVATGRRYRRLPIRAGDPIPPKGSRPRRG